MLARKLMMGVGDGINWTEVWNGFNAGSTFARNLVQNVNDIDGVLQPSPANVAGIEGATFTGSAWSATGLTTQHTIKGVAKYPATFKGYLNEPSRANLVYPSRDFTGARWTSTNVTTVLDQTGPDGVANSACSVTATSNGGTLASTATVSASSAKVGSFFIKRITGTGTVEMSVDSGTSYTDVTAGINSTTYTQVTAAATSTNPQLMIRLGTSGDAIAVDYAQVEVGAFPTSPITTTTAAVTRPVTNLTRPTSGVLPVNNFGIDFEVVATTNTAGADMAITSVDALNFFRITAATTTILRLYKRIGSGGVYVLDKTISAYVAGTRYRIQVYQSSVYGMGSRIKVGAGAWSAWSEKNDADGKKDTGVGSFYRIGYDTISGSSFPGNYPYFAILTGTDPKADLIRAADLYPTS